jgi:hypothetical protein
MTQQSTSDPPSLPDDLLAQYDLEDEVGRSTRACVYQARDRVLDQTVALKLLHPRYGADAAFASRLYLTARAAAALGHPTIAAVYDRGPFDGSTFITGEWFADGNLATVLRTSGTLTPRQVVPALARVLDALAVAHASGIVHGDLHPRNLLLRGSEAHGALVIADFGMGFVREWAEGRSGAIDDDVAPYRAPEAQPGTAAVAATDLYAVATILYEALTGGYPAREGVWRRPAAIPRPLFATLERALSPDPAARYPSAIALRDALASAVGATVPASWVAAPAGQLSEAVRVERRPADPPVARPWRSPRTAALLVTGALALGGLTGTAVFVQAGAPGFPSRAPLGTAAAVPSADITLETEGAPTPETTPAPVVVPTPTFATSAPPATAAAAPSSPVATLSAGAAALAPAHGFVPPAQFTPTPRPSTSPSPAAASAPPRVVSSGGVVGVTLENFSPSLLSGAYQPLDDQRRDGAQVALYGAGSGYNVGILTFEATVAPSGQLTLVLTGLDDEQEAHSTIQILLNGTTLFSGASGFDNRPAIGAAAGGTLPWGQMRVVVPAGTLKLGQNSLVVRNTTAGDQLAPPYVLIHDLQIVAEAP